MRLAILYRLAIPLLLALASATVFFRMLLLVLLAVVFVGLLVLVSRITGKKHGRVEPSAGKGTRVIEGTYKVVDDQQEPPR
jgi:hypothetical protein